MVKSWILLPVPLHHPVLLCQMVQGIAVHARMRGGPLRDRNSNNAIHLPLPTTMCALLPALLSHHVQFSAVPHNSTIFAFYIICLLYKVVSMSKFCFSREKSA